MKTIYIKSLIHSIFFLFIILNILIYRDSGKHPKQKIKYAVVYGNKAENISKPSNRLKARLDACIYLYDISIIEYIIISGGIDECGIDESMVMKNYLINNGINNNNIIRDSLGVNTHLTSKNLNKIINNNYRIVAISQKYHLSRVQLSLRNNGFNNIYTYYPEFYEIRDIYSIIRELPAWIKYYIFNL